MIHSALATEQRLNNRTTVTGFKNITTSELDAICNRHGKIYTAKITPEGIKPQIFLKFKDAPEVDEEKGAAGVDTSNIKATNVDTVIAGISELLGGVCVSRKAVRTTWTLCFDVRTVTMAQCVALRQHPSYSIIDVIIRASSGGSNQQAASLAKQMLIVVAPRRLFQASSSCSPRKTTPRLR